MSAGGRANEFRVLGPLDVWVAGAHVAVDSRKLRILLAALLLQANSVVELDRLAEFLWEDRRPANPRAALHTYVRRLRMLLGDTGLVATASTGYSIELGEDELDLFRFRRLVRTAERAPEPAERARLLTEALAVWRGPALADIPSDSLRLEEYEGLEEERLTALEARFEAELMLGRHASLIKDLRASAIDNPLRERFWELLMLALYRAGRQAEALEIYQQVRRRLVEELGIDPGERLQALHHGILESDPSLAAPDTAPAEPGPAAAVPAQLPPGALGFVGRQKLAERIARVLPPVPSRTGVPIVVLSGPPGVGKSALAVSVGRGLRQSFPHGQLYVNLRGYDRLGQDPPLAPEQVLAQFLRSLGVPAKQIPVELDEQVNLYRSRLAGKNVLIVLDNAASVEQVMPLVPGEAGCSVLVTSRHRLRVLVASQGAQVIQVDTLSPAESCELIDGMLRQAGVAIDPQVVPEVAQLCAHLPLALRIAAANLINAPGGQTGEYLDNLRRGNRLAALAVEDDMSSAVAGAIALSYDAIDPDGQAMFRMAGLFPGAEFAANAVAVLADTSAAQARATLNRLEAANLLQQHAPGRYQFHDLLREFACERAFAETTAEQRAKALERLGQWYLVGVRNAVDDLHTEFVRLALPAGMPAAAEAPQFADESQATAWLIAERRNLMACVRFFGAEGPHYLSWYLADALRGFFWTGKYRSEWDEAARTGLTAAEQGTDQHGIASMHRSLANLHNTLGDYRRAMAHHRQSMAAHRELGMVEEVAATLNNLGLAHLSLSQLDEAEQAAGDALAIARESDFPRIEAAALGLLGSIHWTRGNMAEADAAITASLAAADRLGLHHIACYGLRNLGMVHQAVGDPAGARGYFRRALDISQRIDSLYDRSIALYGLALVEHDFGRHAEAMEAARQALAAFQECGDRTWEVETLCTISLIAQGLGEPVESARYATTAVEAARQIGYPDGEAHALARLAVTSYTDGCVREAAAYAEAASGLIDASASRITQGRVLVQLVPALLEFGDPQAADEHARRLLAVSEGSGQALGTARAKQALGTLAAGRGETEQARVLLTDAFTVLAEVGIPEAETVRALLRTLPSC
ncbi:BTAD domain-containing putative transcriptional regulator [Kitasatospora sp. NPDC092948]|uniref:AfsR/SARP family transcriptional regulator n=1 Tax=Kitasatospora sp. NPDC092948 TaxID=3364088 RepID=UPI003806C89F